MWLFIYTLGRIIIYRKDLLVWVRKYLLIYAPVLVLALCAYGMRRVSQIQHELSFGMFTQKGFAAMGTSLLAVIVFILVLVIVMPLRVVERK